MLEFDYLIERNDGKSINKYTPIINSKLENLISISAPNDFGKSTLLNLIALSFFGLENKRINPSLIERMESLVSSDRQKVKFEINITKDNLKLHILSKKGDLNNSEISRFEKIDNGDFKRITQEYFDRNYLLIYDIPDNPLGRINELNKDLYQKQHKIGDRIKSLSIYIRDIITEISNSKDPKKIKEL
jgi:DNA repair protein SbcC/Rad50